LVAEDGQLGWDKLNENAGLIDLILMDVEMPNMTGLELSRVIRADERFYDIPIIMLTSLAKESDVEEGKKAGATEYLIKMDQEMVRHNVNRYLEKSDALKAGQSNTDNSTGEGDHVRN
jgi:two-component system chemotaxis sensor kinase CheA